jgi:vacuolar-type H+-ATPase subunit E/Vma4
MGIVLRRADIVPLEEKREIEERLSMYDDLMEKDPKMRKIRAESEVRGEARGEAKMLRKVILSVIKRRFPSLLAIAQQRVQSLTRPDDLDTLFEQIEDASDEATARSFLISSFE